MEKCYIKLLNGVQYIVLVTKGPKGIVFVALVLS